MLCDDGRIAVNAVEHRAGPSKRVTELMLIYGTRALPGQLFDADSGRISLTKGNESFRGAISVDHPGGKITIQGKLRLDGETLDVDTTLDCRQMQDSSRS